MKTATVADLRNNFRRVSSWIEHGETVQIIKRGRACAQLVATPPSTPVLVPKVEFLTFDGKQKQLAEAEGLVVPVTATSSAENP